MSSQIALVDTASVGVPSLVSVGTSDMVMNSVDVAFVDEVLARPSGRGFWLTTNPIMPPSGHGKLWYLVKLVQARDGPTVIHDREDN